MMRFRRFYFIYTSVVYSILPILTTSFTLTNSVRSRLSVPKMTIGEENEAAEDSTTTASSIMLDATSTNNMKEITNSNFEISWEPGIAQRIFKEYKAMKAKQTRIIEKGGRHPNNRPYMVAFVGIPGSGKTTSASIMQEILIDYFQNDGIHRTAEDSPVMIIPMDGYHLPMSALQSKPNAKEWIYKRGAPETFDPQSLLHDLKRIRSIFGAETSSFISDDNIVDTNNEENGNIHDVVHIPGFDHAIGDPQPNEYTFRRNQHEIVVCEGLYLLHQESQEDLKNVVGWTEEIQNQFDLTVFIHANINTCIERLKIRNKCIPGYTPEEIDIRCEKVDRKNATVVLESKDRAMVVVDSAVA